MISLKNITRSLHIIIFFAGFLPFCSIEFKECSSSYAYHESLIDNLKRDSLVMADSANIMNEFMQTGATFNIDSFWRFYNSRKISEHFLDSVIREDSVRRSIGRDTTNNTVDFSAYIFLEFTVRAGTKSLFEKPIGTVFYLSIDGIIILSWIGVFIVFMKRNYRYRYLRNISVMGTILCLITYSIWLPCFPDFHIEYGAIILSVLFPVTLILNQLIVRSEQ